MEFTDTSPSFSNPIHPPLPLDNGSQPATEGQEDADIFRGEPPPRPSTPVSVTTSSSSSSSSLLGGRFTAIAAVVELAISRWARTTASSSDTSSISSSILTLARSRTTRRRRRASSTNLHSLQSERDLAARFRAREESRHIPREFVLYLPPLLCSQGAQGKYLALPQPISRTSSLPLILGQLDTALKQYTKSRRSNRPRAKSPDPIPPIAALPHQDYMLPDVLRAPSRPASFTDLNVLRTTRKGKERETPVPSSVTSSSEKGGVNNRAPKAWWLDVSSPTWEDMRAIGKLLHLHPLTLEDILQQDPREKLELFPRLGYYFVSFRAIESQATRERFRLHSAVDADHDNGGAVGEVNVYLVVFREGICSFHFTDIAEHTERVRNRLTLLEENVNMSSDWIAHGILDSIVDSFFPFLEEVEKEVLGVENFVFSDDFRRGHAGRLQIPATTSISSSQTEIPATNEKHDSVEKLSLSVNEKYPPTSDRGAVKTRFSLPRLTIPLFIRRLKRTILSLSLPVSFTVEIHRTTGDPTVFLLRRIVRTRRLVTSLTRLLATKSEVVAQIRKRLLTSGHSGLGNGTGKEDDVEVAIYMGDVQDHILTLQHSLAHYERMLSQSHPTYLSQLRASVETTKSGTDKAVMILTIVSMGVLCSQTIIGMVSMNVNVPSNVKEPYGRYNIFGIVITMVFVTSGTFLMVVRRWWLQAKRGRSML